MVIVIGTGTGIEDIGIVMRGMIDIIEMEEAVDENANRGIMTGRETIEEGLEGIEMGMEEVVEEDVEDMKEGEDMMMIEGEGGMMMERALLSRWGVGVEVVEVVEEEGAVGKGGDMMKHHLQLR